MQDADLSRMVRQFEASEHASQASRAEAERARDYRDGRQLTDAELKALRKRKQPPVVVNRIGRKIDYLLGLERQNRTDPRAFPRNMADEQASEAATDALRYVDRDQLVDMARSCVFDNMLVEGFGGLEITAQQVKGAIDPKVKHIAWHRLFFDPHSCEGDFSDARYVGYVTWMDEAEALDRWPEAADAIKITMETPTSTASDTYDDKPKWAYWADSKRKRVRVVTQYYRGKAGQGWMACTYTLAGFLDAPAPSPWLDENGEPECPLLLQSAYIDRDNDRYGVVRSMFDVQDEINKRRSKALHLLNSRQVRVARGFEKSIEIIRSEIAKPDGVIAADEGEIEILQTNDLAMGQFNLLQEAKAELDAMGPNATMQGKRGEDQSGRAILALQQGGMVEMAPLFDALRHLNIRMYRQIWNRIRQFWTQERWIRVTDDERNVRFVGVNVTEGALAMQKLKAALDAGQIDQQTAAAYAQQIAADPAMQQPANNIAELDVDIDIDEQPNTPTLQAEQFEALAKIAATGVVPIPPEVLIEASNLRNKDKLLKMLKGEGGGPQAPSPQDLMAAQAEAAQAEAQMQGQIEIEKAKIGAAAKIEVAQINAQADLVIAQAKGEIDMERAAQEIALRRDSEMERLSLDAAVKAQEAQQREADSERAAQERAAQQTEAPKPEPQPDNGAEMARMAAKLEGLTELMSAVTRPRKKIAYRDAQDRLVMEEVDDEQG